jgi:predicted NUDIX family NTP pyrophosphohydrolase
MPEISAGIIVYRRGPEGLEVLLVHPGGPFWARKDAGAWSIPKGLVEAGEGREAAARREFAEETGFHAEGDLHPLGEFRQRSGKRVIAFALEGNFDAAELASNSFEMEWPPGSGQQRSFPEIDRAGWFAPDEARLKLVVGQVPILEALLRAASPYRPLAPLGRGSG